MLEPNQFTVKCRESWTWMFNKLNSLPPTVAGAASLKFRKVNFTSHAVTCVPSWNRKSLRSSTLNCWLPDDVVVGVNVLHIQQNAFAGWIGLAENSVS